jgi:hypothetical protein
VDEVDGENVWCRTGAGGSSSTKYTGPVLADVERTMQSAKGISKGMVEKNMGGGGDSMAGGTCEQKGEEIEGDSLSMSMSGLRKKREINGGVKLVESGNKIQNSQLNIQHGLGVVVAVKQPR